MAAATLAAATLGTPGSALAAAEPDREREGDVAPGVPPPSGGDPALDTGFDPGAPPAEPPTETLVGADGDAPVDPRGLDDGAVEAEPNVPLIPEEEQAGALGVEQAPPVGGGADEPLGQAPGTTGAERLGTAPRRGESDGVDAGTRARGPRAEETPASKHRAGSPTEDSRAGSKPAPGPALATPYDRVDRAAVTSEARPAPAQIGDARSARFHVVRPGESLWSIAHGLLGPDATAADIARAVDRLWRLNAERIGTGSPDLILPGQKLLLP